MSTVGPVESSVRSGGVRLRLLGPLAIDGVDAIGDRKSRSLLALLAAECGRPVASDLIIEVLWGDALPAAPADQISVLVSRLRRVLGAERIVRTDGGYALAADWVDVVELDGLVDRAASRLADGSNASALTSARAAVALVRGPFAAGESAVWFEERRRTVERTVLRARSIIAEGALAEGDARTAIAMSEALRDADPYDEAAAAMLMRAQVAAGRPSSALATYAALRQLLADDLGARPSPELQRLHGAVLAADTSDDEVSESADDPGLVRLVEALADVEVTGRAAAVVITGDAGAGGSALLAAFCGLAAQRDALVLVGRAG
ncbi:MAG: AfsR/SARP family transcriptional regulator [Ilumatobacteraceae bacterium]